MDRSTGPSIAPRMGANVVLVACGIAIGAALMYFIDPDNGRRRRALARDKSLHYARVATERGERRVRHATHRARGAIAAAGRRAGAGEIVEDRILLERVRAALGHVVGDPNAVDVRVRCGTVILKGPARQDQIGELVACAAHVPGVLEVENRLSINPDQPAPADEKGGPTPLGRMYPDGIAR